MRVRMLKVGWKCQPEIYDDYYGWIGFSTVCHSWGPTTYPKRFWARQGAQDLLDSLKEFDV